MAASGAPERTDKHAQNVADLALRMLESVQKLDTSKDSKIEIRIGTRNEKVFRCFRTLLQEFIVDLR